MSSRLAARVVREIERLGGRLDPEAALEATIATVRGKRTVTGAMAQLAGAVVWPEQVCRAVADEYPSEVEFGTTEVVDAYDDARTPVVQIAFDRTTGVVYLVPLESRNKADPTVHGVDRDASEASLGRGQSLSAFLANLIPRARTTTGQFAFADERLEAALLRALAKRCKAKLHVPPSRAELDRLEDVSLKVSASDLSGIEHFRKLKKLKITGCHELRDVSPLAKLEYLEEVAIDTISLETLAPLAKANHVRKLSFGSDDKLDLRPLLSMKKLESVRIDFGIWEEPKGADGVITKLAQKGVKVVIIGG